MLHNFRLTLFAVALSLAAASSLAAEEVERAQVVRAQEGMIWAGMVPIVLISIVCGFVYLARIIADHRRWLHAVRLQTEMHTKIVDRLSGSEELLGYLQSPSGQRVLSLTPAVEGSPGSSASPATRILRSVQTGIVLALAGAGLWIGAGRAVDEIAEALRIVAILTGAVGIGFVLSAAVSLTLSRRLGLIDTPSHVA